MSIAHFQCCLSVSYSSISHDHDIIYYSFHFFITVALKNLLPKSILVVFFLIFLLVLTSLLDWLHLSLLSWSHNLLLYTFTFSLTSEEAFLNRHIRKSIQSIALTSCNSNKCVWILQSQVIECYSNVDQQCKYLYHNIVAEIYFSWNKSGTNTSLRSPSYPDLSLCM